MELIDKVKRALIDSGFPLEIKIAGLLKEQDWKIDVGHKYTDFETGKLREIDIIANRSINGIEVHLFIECKKSNNKQLVLYAPKHNRDHQSLLNPLKYFPRFYGKNMLKERKKQLDEAWSNIPFFDDTVPISNNIIFTKGDKIEQNNDAFFSSLNGIIKSSIDRGSDGYIETNFRMIFFHIMIYEGEIFQVTPSVNHELDIIEIPYGQYQFKYKFKFTESDTYDIKDIIKTSRPFCFSNNIEIMHPRYFSEYLEKLTLGLLEIPKKKFKGWGHSMEKYIDKYL